MNDSGRIRGRVDAVGTITVINASVAQVKLTLRFNLTENDRRNLGSGMSIAVVDVGLVPGPMHEGRSGGGKFGHLKISAGKPIGFWEARAAILASWWAVADHLDAVAAVERLKRLKIIV